MFSGSSCTQYTFASLYLFNSLVTCFSGKGLQLLQANDGDVFPLILFLLLQQVIVHFAGAQQQPFHQTWLGGHRHRPSPPEICLL